MTETAYDWDGTIQNDGNDYVVFTKGEYNFTVVSMERARYSPKEGAKLPACNMANVKLRFEDEEQGVVTIEESLKLHSKLEWILAAFFRSIGQKKHGEPLKMNWMAVPGATGRAKLEVREWTNDDKTTGKINRVKSFLDPIDSATNTPAPAQDADGGF